jgi:CheY-like chemotaxis protein
VLVGARRRGADVAIEVRDSGPGVPEGAQREIFDAFHQLPGSSRTGLGLGLSIVEGLAQVLGHAVEVRSVVARGSVFSVRAARAAAAPERGDAPLPPAAAPFAARRVLVVDDDAAVRRATAELLRGWGCEVREAGGADEALAAAADWEPEWVLADYQLGSGGTGTELVTRLRAAQGADLAAAIVTGDSEGPGLEALRAAGFLVLRKPVAPARLRALLAAPRPPT